MKLKEKQAIDEVIQDMNEDRDEGNDDLVKDKEKELIEEMNNSNILVLKRALHSKNSPHDNQRLNIFQIICIINGKTCSIIIDSGSYANVAFITLVEKLKLPSSPYLQPYKL